MGFSVSHHKLSTICYIVILLCGFSIGSRDNFMSIEVEDEGTKGDLEQAETKDAKASEIIKHIRKVNGDGTYTVGFETDDGTFKIETKDVLGNIKGTFGYIDDNGEIKRVSYTTNHTSGLQDIPSPVVEDIDEDESETIQPSPTTHKYNRTYGSFASTTRRPSSLAFLTSTTNPLQNTKSSVIQSIPKRRILLPSERSTLKNSDGIVVEPTTTIVYATSLPTPKPKTSDQIARPERIEIDHVSKVTVSKNSGKKERNEEKHTKHEVRGNLLRRQLKQDNEEAFEAQQQVLYSQSAGEEGSHIYGGNYGGVRPLYTTTSSPKVPAAVLAARQRAAQLQSLLASSSPSTTTEKVYVKAPKRQSILKPKVDEATESTSENNFQIPANKEETEAADEQRRNLRERPLAPQLDQLYRPRNYLRQLQQQQQQQQLQEQGQELGDERGPAPRGFRIPLSTGQEPFPQGDFRQSSTPGPLGLQAAQRFAQQYAPQNQGPSQGGPGPDQADESYPAASPFFSPQGLPPGGIPGGYRGGAPLSSGLGGGLGGAYDYDRPLTVRDFERLLQLLVFRQNQYGRYNPYYPLPNNPTGFPPYVPPYNAPYQQIPRPPPYFGGGGNLGGLYDPYFRNPSYSPSSQVPQYQGDGAYQASRPLETSTPYDIPRLSQSQRRRPFDPRLLAEAGQPSEQEINYNSLQNSPADQSYIPSSVREQLLYRMLMLAIQSDPQLAAAASNTQAVVDLPTEATKDLKKTKASSKKPIRSVQILGEEEDESQEEAKEE